MSNGDPPNSGPSIEGFTDFELIGTGGFGSVYRARELSPPRDVAIKILHNVEFDDTARRRFDREQATMASVSHPGIVTLHQTGFTADERPYLVMEYMAAGSLADIVKESGPVSPSEAASIMVAVTEAVAAVHAAGVFHRDIKPANILMSEHGPKLGDFGIATALDRTATQTTSITASIEHAAPEILDGQPATELSDIYSLGSTLFTLVAGRSPFRQGDEESVLAIIKRVGTDPVPDLRPEGVPDHLMSIIEQATAKDPAQRPQSAAEFADMLRRFAAGDAPADSAGPVGDPSVTRVVTQAPPPPDTASTPTTRAESAPSRPRVGLIAAIAAIAIAVVVVFVVSSGNGDDPAPTSLASEEPVTTSTAAPTTTTIAATTTAAPATTTSTSTTTTQPGVVLEPPPAFPQTIPGNGAGFAADGSGCVADTDEDLPDGVWFGYAVQARAGGSLALDFDLGCFYSGSAAAAEANHDGLAATDPYIRNRNPALFRVPVEAAADVFWLGFDGLHHQTIYDRWFLDSDGAVPCPGVGCSVWIEVRGGSIILIWEQFD